MIYWYWYIDIDISIYFSPLNSQPAVSTVDCACIDQWEAELTRSRPIATRTGLVSSVSSGLVTLGVVHFLFLSTGIANFWFPITQYLKFLEVLSGGLGRPLFWCYKRIPEKRVNYGTFQTAPLAWAVSILRSVCVCVGMSESFYGRRPDH